MKYKYTRKQAIELIRRDWNFEIMKNVLLAKEQGEKKPKLKHAYFTSPIFHEKTISTPPLKEDRKEIEKITLGMKESFDPSIETRTLILMRFGDKINELVDAVNHLSSVEK